MSKQTKYLSNEELSAFCQQIAMVLNAGLPTYYGISILCDEAADDATRDLLTQIYEPMEIGGTLHEALENTNRFPKYMINMIQIGEETGRLENVLLALRVYYEREASIISSIKSAITYPLILSTMMMVVIVTMITKVLPVFSQIYNQLGSELSGSAKILMDISNIINKHLLVLIFILAIMIIGIVLFFRTDLGKIIYQGRPLSMSIAASRFANSIHLALCSGLDTDKGLDLAYQLVNNAHMEEKINNCRNHIAHGETFPNALLMSGIFSKMYSSWIAIGYKTGSLDDVMKRIGASYEDNTDKKISHFISILEPTLVIILCFFIGLILISFLLPLLGIMSSIG